MRIAFITLILLVAGCSNTWQGVKDDSSKVWEDTKQAIHEATED
ncbi:entericidin EcnAB [Vibrio sp. Of14-4]|uniref:Entericidin EcnAB n=1 Tax=Vibrio tetraodonis subsp. pristinus TaxID=2695891 RepID=A0A6L8LV43_9VIBR|nr:MULTISPECIES: entericidin EcnAB [Vibrio]MCG7488550.1 entericidin EcnAB [Vibrio sp. Of14-4]MYM59353.1 entericidin EcnAB [Vibrio tetraodonis subsp. pristinus]